MILALRYHIGRNWLTLYRFDRIDILGCRTIVAFSQEDCSISSTDGIIWIAIRTAKSPRLHTRNSRAPWRVGQRIPILRRCPTPFAHARRLGTPSSSCAGNKKGYLSWFTPSNQIRRGWRSCGPQQPICLEANRKALGQARHNLNV